MGFWRKITNWFNETVEGLVLPEQGKETKMSDQAIIQILIKAAKHAQEVSIKRKFGPRQRVGEFVTALRREFGYAGLVEHVRNFAKKGSWRDILEPISDVRDNQLVSLSYRAREDAGWLKLKDGVFHKTELGGMHQKYHDTENDGEIKTQISGTPVVISRKAWKFGNYSTAVHYAHDGTTIHSMKTLCDIQLNSSDIALQLVKNDSVLQCSCAKCNAALDAAERSGKRVVIARVKKKKTETAKRGKSHADTITASRKGITQKRGKVPKGCVRYVCKDCSQTITVNTANKPTECFQCNSENIAEESDITITARSTDQKSGYPQPTLKRWVCQACHVPATSKIKPKACGKCGHANFVLDNSPIPTKKHWVCSKCNCQHHTSEKPDKCCSCGCDDLPTVFGKGAAQPPKTGSLRAQEDAKRKSWPDHVEGLP